VTDAELRALLVDCLVLWQVKGDVFLGDAIIQIRTTGGCFGLLRAAPNERPARWFLSSSAGEAAARGSRALPSIVAALNALRREIVGY
jgi:hypothetical protein